jgi:hypothetical protein
MRSRRVLYHSQSLSSLTLIRRILLFRVDLHRRLSSYEISQIESRTRQITQLCLISRRNLYRCSFKLIAHVLLRKRVLRSSMHFTSSSWILPFSCYHCEPHDLGIRTRSNSPRMKWRHGTPNWVWFQDFAGTSAKQRATKPWPRWLRTLGLSSTGAAGVLLQRTALGF